VCLCVCRLIAVMVKLRCCSSSTVNWSSVPSVVMFSQILASYLAPSTRSVRRASRRTLLNSRVAGPCHVLYVGRRSLCRQVESPTCLSTPSSRDCSIYATSLMLPHHSTLKVKMEVKVRLEVKVMSLSRPLVPTSRASCGTFGFVVII